MAEMTINITDEMIQAAVREQVKAKLSKIDIKDMVKTEVRIMVHKSWNELKADSLIKDIKTQRIVNGIVEELTDRITRSFDDDF